MSSDFDNRNVPGRPENRDLLVPPGSHAFVQIVTSGEVRVAVGPRPITFSGQERPVRFNDTTDSFEPCTQDQSLRKNVSLREGYYAILENPALGDNGNIVYPSSDPNATHKGLQMGRRVIICGPIDFALWPRQKATVIQGHSLRSNQYLEAVVYDSESARKNWTSAAIVAAPANPPSSNSGTAASGGSTPNPSASAETKAAEQTQVAPSAQNLVMGQRLIITGESVSFYIPPTGVEVVAENGSYVREAVTLERLEYCILVDENGNKRYEHGPAVVFPKATERFFAAGGTRKFKAIELPEKAGIHVKVIADHDAETPDGKVTHRAGEELFITGDEQAIYYPSEFHSIIKYGDGQMVHFGVAIPKGEGRYVMNRITGEIRTVVGPSILLCDPRKEVIVRRILTDSQCIDWYPGNSEALNHNRQLRQIQEAAGSTRGDVVEDSYTRSASRLTSARGAMAASYASPQAMGLHSEGLASAFEERAANAVLADEFSRSAKFTPPRSLTLNTKYEGVPTIDVWTGYAVMVVDKSGNRRVEQGPTTVLLDYDETLEILNLSTGKPKSTDRLYRTVYLRTQNNKVSDIIDVETSDHVRCQIKLSFNVNFEGDGNRWFNSDNYVKLLCDHVRSVMKGEIKKHPIEKFYADATAIIRNTILGEKTNGAPRAGLIFEQNGMKIVDVEVLDNTILDSNIGTILVKAQREVVESNISLATARRQLEAARQQEEMERERVTAKAATERHKADIDLARVADSLKLAIARADSELSQAAATRKLVEARIATTNLEDTSRLEREKAEAEQQLAINRAEQALEMEKLNLETEATVKRFAAVSGDFSETIAFLNREENLVKVAQAVSFQTLIGGKSVSDVLTTIFGADSPISKRLGNLSASMAGSALVNAVSNR